MVGLKLLGWLCERLFVLSGSIFTAAGLLLAGSWQLVVSRKRSALASASRIREPDGAI